MYTDYDSGLTITVLITISAYYCSKDKEIRQFLRDNVHQVGKIAPGLIKYASSEINNIAQQRINQLSR